MITNTKRSNSDTEIVGPLMAEAFESEDIIENFISVKGANHAEADPLIVSLISGERSILTGVRGTGKTMLMATSEAILKEKCKAGSLDLLPVFITFSGFRADVSLQEELDLTREEISAAREIFRGYFFMTLLNEILNNVEELDLDENVMFNWFGVRTKFGIKREIKNAIQTFKRLGFREIIKNKNAGIGITVPIENIPIEFGPNLEVSNETKEITLNDIQKTALFLETIQGICDAYKIKKIYFLFDEVHYLKFLQAEFFDILFGFRNEKSITFSISAYPTYMDYGSSFDIPDDAKDISISVPLYKPNKKDFDSSFMKLIEARIKKFGNKERTEIITDEAAEQLFLLCNGNPRIILQAIDYIWKRNLYKKITMGSLSNDVISEMVNVYYLDFMKKQAKRYKTNFEKAQNFLNVIIDRLRDYNKKNDKVTALFLLNEDIINIYSDTIDLLVYSRIIDKIRISSFGSSSNKKGILYLINPMVATYYGAFINKSKINLLTQHLKDALDKDKKIQFTSIDTFTVKDDENQISCPRYLDKSCPEPKCKGSYSEEWKICPFHNGLSLELRLPLAEEIPVKILSLSERMVKRLEDNGVNNLKDILNLEIEGLQKIDQIGPIRSKNIYFLAQEYIDDNL